MTVAVEIDTNPPWDKDKKRILVSAEFRDKELVKTIPGHKWDEGARSWWFPLGWPSCVMLRGTFGDRLQIGEELTEWASNEVTNRVNPCLWLREQKDYPYVTERYALGEKLLPFQRVGAAFMAWGKRTLIGDEMGLGKTVQVIAALELLGDDAYPALIVCNTSMKRGWRDEFATWAPGRKVQIISGSAAKRRKQFAEPADVYVMNWELLAKHGRLSGYGYIRLSEKEKEDGDLQLKGFRTKVADEVHRAKDPKAKQTRAWWAVPAKNVIGVTATPVANSPEDLWSIMHGIAPDEWPSKTAFVDRFALQSWNGFGGMSVVGIKSEAREEFFKILDPRFIRRPTAAVLPELDALKLPPQRRLVDLGTKQRKAYDSLKKEMIADLESGVLVATNPLERLGRLRQFACAYGEVDENGALTLTDPSCKVDALLEILEETGGLQVAVFAESRQLIELAHRRLTHEKISCVMVTGAVNEADKALHVQEFQGGKHQVILLTLGAGSESITLTAAHKGIFLQRSFSQLKNTQAEGRLPRIGLDHRVQYIDVVAADTVEEAMFDVLADKERRLEEVVRDEETLRRWLA